MVLHIERESSPLELLLCSLCFNMRVLTLFVLLGFAQGFAPQHHVPASRIVRAASPERQNARPERSSTVALAPAQPKIKIAAKPTPGGGSPQKQQTKTVQVAPPERKTEDAEVPMWKVVLLGDEEYDEAYVVQTIKQVVVQVTREKCESCFQEAQQHGASEIVVVPQEHAEHFVQQFHRCDPVVYTTCEPEKIVN